MIRVQNKKIITKARKRINASKCELTSTASLRNEYLLRSETVVFFLSSFVVGAVVGG